MKPRFAFKTRDGLFAFDECQDVDDNAAYIMRPLKPYPPMAGNPPMRTNFCDYRKYERTHMKYDRLPLFEEVNA